MNADDSLFWQVFTGFTTAGAFVGMVVGVLLFILVVLAVASVIWPFLILKAIYGDG